ncbi:MAG: YdcF family protein [Cyanobacteria bacterium J06598_3]
MLESAMCQQASPTRLWTLVSWTFVFVLSHHPGILILAGLALVSVPWLCHLHRWKKPVIVLAIALCVGYVVISSPWVVGVGNRLLAGAVPPDTGEKVEAIVVLGRGRQQNAVRSRAAFDLLQVNRAPLVFSSGRRDAKVIASLLEDWAVPSSAIGGEPCSLTTEQNAEFTAALLWPQGVRSIILVTDGPHMLRSLLTFESFGFKVIPHIVPLDAGTNPAKSRFLVFRESLGLLSYGLMGRYFSREVPPTSVIYADGQASAPTLNLDS